MYVNSSVFPKGTTVTGVVRESEPGTPSFIVVSQSATGNATGSTIRFHGELLGGSQSAATQIAISNTNLDSRTVTTLLRTVDESTSDIRGHLTIHKEYDSSVFINFALNGINVEEANQTILKISSVSSSSANPFSADDKLVVSFARTGNKGQKGGSGTNGTNGDKGQKGEQGRDGNFGGATFDYTFDSATGVPSWSLASDAGELRLNKTKAEGQHNTTIIYVHPNNDQGDSKQSFLETIDSIDSNIKGFVRITEKHDSTKFLMFSISDLVDNTSTNGSWKITVTNVGYSATDVFSNDDNILVSWATSGKKGQKGEKGVLGQKGEVGNKGEKGQKGQIGLTGDKGDKGEIGGEGQKGDTGQKGEVGNKGEKGQKGITGAIGGGNWRTFDFETAVQETVDVGKLNIKKAWSSITATDTGLQINISQTDNTSPIKRDVAYWIQSFTNYGVPSDYGILQISQTDKPENRLTGKVTNLAFNQNNSYSIVTLDIIDINSITSNGIDNNSEVIVSFTPNGAKGQKGSVGLTGDKGQKGEIGNTGAKGQKGEKGAKGEVGPQGEKGPQGDKGNQSTVAGPKGDTGTVLGGLGMLDGWYVTGDSGAQSNVFTENVEFTQLPSTNGNATRGFIRESGNQMTYSSAANQGFSFPQTGLYVIQGNFEVYLATDLRTGHSYLQAFMTKNNGASWDSLAITTVYKPVLNGNERDFGINQTFSMKITVNIEE